MSDEAVQDPLGQAGAYAAAELLGQLAQFDPHSAVNQPAASPACRLCGRLGASPDMDRQKGGAAGEGGVGRSDS